MKIRTIWVWVKSEGIEGAWLEWAVDEYTLDENPDCYTQALAKARASHGECVGVVDLNGPTYPDIAKALAVPCLEAELS